MLCRQIQRDRKRQGTKQALASIRQNVAAGEQQQIAAAASAATATDKQQQQQQEFI